MVDIPGTQRHSARRGTLSFRPAFLAAAVHIIDLPCPDPNPASPRTAPSAACPCRRKQSAAVATRAHQRAEVEKRDLGPVGSVPMTTVARQGHAQRCACTSPCVCSKGCKTVIIERPYESLELRTAQAQCRPAAGRLWRKTWPRGVPRVRPGWRGHRSPPSGTRPHQRGAPRGTGPDSPQRHEDQTQPCGRRARGGRK
jgi:hypothetical protein